jgi:hypothetical protein
MVPERIILIETLKKTKRKRKKEEGRRKKEEGRRKKEENYSFFSFKLHHSYSDLFYFEFARSDLNIKLVLISDYLNPTLI